MAVTMFLRRGVSGEPWLDVHCLARTGATWRLLGGGSGNIDERIFGARRHLADAQNLGVILGGGGVKLQKRGFPAPGTRWASWAELWLPEDVAALRVRDRHIPVAAHGVAVVMWTSRQSPRVVALDDAARRLGPVPLLYG